MLTNVSTGTVLTSLRETTTTDEAHVLAACREAGHAIAAWFLADSPIDSVTILPGKASIGTLARQHLLDGIDFEMEDSDEIRLNWYRIQDAIVISLAGPYAQRRYAPSSKWRRGRDFKEASDLVYHLHEHRRTPAKMIPMYWQYANADADDFLDKFWTIIKAVARRLVERNTLSKDEAMAIGREAVRNGSTIEWPIDNHLGA